MIKVNLVPAEILAKARQRHLAFQASLIGSFLVVLVVLASLYHWYGLHRLQEDYSYQEAKLKRLEKVVAQVEELEKAATAVRARLGVIEDLLKGRAFYPIFMSDFARSVPAGVRVVSLNTSVQSGSLRLSIGAVGATNEDVAAWVRTLQNTSRFGSVELGAISSSGKQFSFTMTAVYTNKL